MQLYHTSDLCLQMATEQATPRTGKKAEERSPTRAASLSPTSPIKTSVATVPLMKMIGGVAKATHAAAVAKQASHRGIQHLCTHFTTCKEGRCQTCKCAKCLPCQASGKRASTPTRKFD